MDCPELYESAGRQPRDMAYSEIAASSKKAGAVSHPEYADPDNRCEIPEAIISLFPNAALDQIVGTEEQTAVVKEWRISVNAVLSEVVRVISEGVPAMTQGVVP